MAEWARLLSECWVKPVAGSNPALPATQNTFRKGRVFVFQSRAPIEGMVFEFNQSLKFSIPLNIKRGCLQRSYPIFSRKGKIGKNTSELKQRRHGILEIKDHIIAGEEFFQPVDELTVFYCGWQGIHQHGGGKHVGGSTQWGDAARLWGKERIHEHWVGSK